MRLILTIVLAAILISISSETFAQLNTTTLNSSIITGNLVLDKNTKYLMSGFNYVKNGGSITIPAGTVILGEFTSKGTLIIERGGKIFANGTPDAPVIFTSQRPAGTRANGDWGGVIILGRAAINTATGADSAEIEGFGPGLGPVYGGQPVINNDNSGVLRYVRIEFPGVNLTGISGNEINGLTMGGVGSGTTIEYVQVSYSGDDSFEWFGGTVNCSHLIAYKGLDDDWDTDNGFRGHIQFGLSVRDSGLVDISTSNGFESDNNAQSPVNFNNPRTKPVYSNMTVVGPYSSTSLNLSTLWGRGSHERRNSLESIYNSIIMGWRVGVRFDGTGVANASTTDTIQYRNNIFGGNVTLADNAANSFNGPAFLQTPSYNNTVFSGSSSVQLTNPFGIYPVPLPANNVDNWVPLSGSPALSGADFSNPNLSGFQNVSYRGAFGTNNWTYQWAQFNPVNYLIPTTSNYFVTIFPEGFYDSNTGQLNSSDTLRLYLRETSAPYNVIDSSTAIFNNTTFICKFVFKYAPSGTYYLQTYHRNALETWSKAGGEPFTQGADNFYNFTNSASKAYNANQKSVGSGLFGIYSGDVNHDGVIELSDLVDIFNDASVFASGYVVTDVNGDDIVDLSDLTIVFNNSSVFIELQRP